VDVIWQAPDDAVAALVLAHGAGAGMDHPQMHAIAAAFGKRGIATLRFNFPFIEARKQRVDAPQVATARIEAAYAAAAQRTSLPIWLGGHSFGGRMASHAVVDRALAPAGLIFCSFPLHPPAKPATSRAAHLPHVRQPMLFLAGTRDDLADAALLRGVVAALPNARLHFLDTADHGYRVLKRTRSSAEDVFDEMARVARAFVDRVASGSAGTQEPPHVDH
jgi:predicted alpha/beta-hydrolase family hydrolase